ncbi:type II secretion system protein GspL [Flocculibacter collagenilyticus]|uniref:type II secretion system protein GspL n=1 Tax=Flocculibacter collagenilyticus TaxID=2744479 RepID=UPI0018F6083E|nr:type II secretion system protein GspL [Flocculibacter collagenilyticus]
MKEQVFIRLNSQADEPIHWLVWSEQEQEIIASGELENASALTSISHHCSGRQTYVLVPTADVTICRVRLPSKYSRKLQTALPYMLEEDIAQDIDDVHLVVINNDQDDEGYYADVAIVSHQNMESWQEWLDDADIYTQIFAPDALCLPVFDNNMTVTRLKNQWLFRHGKYQAMSIDDSWVSLFLIQQYANHQQDNEESETTLSAPDIHCYDEAVKTHIEHLGLNIKVVDEPAELPLKLCANASRATAFNLLQGTYQQQSNHLKQLKKWRITAIAAGVAFISLLVYKGLEIHQLQQQLDAQQQHLVTIYKDAFPKERVRVSLIRKQLRQKLNAVGSDTGNQLGFIAQLEQVLPAFTGAANLTPESLRFDATRQEVRFQARANDFQTFEQVKGALEKQGLEVNQGALNNDGDAVVGSLIVRNNK